MKVLTAVLAAALLVAASAAFAGCNGHTAEKQSPTATTAGLPVLPAEAAGS